MSEAIYLASPYSHKSKFIQEMRYRAARENACRLLVLGFHVYSPIVHCHELALANGLPGDAIFWHRYNMSLLRACPRFGVLQLPNWRASKGVETEIQEASNLGREIEWFDALGEISEILQKIS